VTPLPTTAVDQRGQFFEADCTPVERAFASSPRKFAFFSQTTFVLPKKGSVCNASIADRIRAAA